MTDLIEYLLGNPMESQTDEWHMQAFQEETVSKWLDFGAAGGAPSWLEITLLEPRCVTGYSLTSADDAPERDPCDFTLEAVLVHASQPAEGPPGESPEHLEWIVLDAREGHHFAARLQSHSFKVSVEWLFLPGYSILPRKFVIILEVSVMCRLWPV